MRDNRPYPINGIFYNANKTDYLFLFNIQQIAIALLKLNRIVNALLPTQLRPWCRVANVRKDVLVLETANASWKMRLRHEQPQLLFALRSQILPSLSYIEIKINPNLARKKELRTQYSCSSWQCHQLINKNTRQLSARSAASILYVASRSEGKLKKMLERIAKLAGKNINSYDS